MAPPKAPAANGPAAASAKGKSIKSPSLTPRELHQIILRVLSLAALAEGPTVMPGSRAERRLHEVLRKIDGLVARAEARVPLADIVDTKGKTIGAFTVGDFDLLELESELRAICKEQKALFGTKKFSPTRFARGLEIAFARAGRPLVPGHAASVAEHVRTIHHADSPSKMAETILARSLLPSGRKIQYLRSVLPASSRARGHLHRPSLNADIAVAQEFLACLQIDRTAVRTEAGRLVAQRETRVKGRGDYTLREACPPPTAEPLGDA